MGLIYHLSMTLCVVILLHFLVSCSAACTTDEDCSYMGKCSEGVCKCDPGFRGPTCAHIDNHTIPIKSGFKSDKFWIWGSQVVFVDGEYHMFAAIFPRNLSFGNHWLTNGQIARATSKTPIGPYQFVEIVLPYHMSTTNQQYWDRSCMNPKIIQAKDGTFLLYYTGDTYNGSTPTQLQPSHSENAQETQRVGLAYAPKITGPWSRLPDPIISPRPGKWDDRMTTNVAVTVLKNGTILAVYKASTPPGSERQSTVCIGVASAQHWKGPYIRLQDDPILPCPKNSFNFEDPSIWYDQKSDTVHMFVKNFRGTVTHAGYSGAHAYSKDNGHTWQFTSPPLAYSTVNTWSDGKIRKQSRMERPEVLLDSNGHVSHVFFATDMGLEGPEWWNMVIPVQSTSTKTFS
ncbi:uncharacterized protein LOC134197190 [Corticium candelabrum]|uniref:uncharacterized protein LOC134197190 n=1 Tax=Corticium candelabrum TaxID=121492 RepID=UPI002E26A2DB|nr:uncharacterized protein LOC134197190 [Corticium candelabrum]